ncbi:MAG: outer membrane beta-barrel protein, partial [Verrucomicrobiota bacterium]
NKWVFGLEATGGYLWLRDSHGDGDFFSSNGNQFFTSTSFKTHYLLTVGSRIGYAFCRWLPYVTGGLAIGDLDFFQQFQAPDFFPEKVGGRTSETNAGWFVGGGLQYSITEHWSARVQYQYVDLGSTSFDHDSAPPTFPSSSKVELREHNASFAIIYGF